jgi:tetratricopeptide (TPR) repeat protein
VLCTVVANLKDCAPFLSVHRAGLAGADLAAWKASFDAGRLAWVYGDVSKAKASLGEALRIDPQYADTQFMLGSLDLQSGDTASARRRFVEALHWDALRFRPDPAINEVIRSVAGTGGGGVSLLDLADELGADPDSTGPISGREVLFEHVHFDWDGNYRLARMMARSCAAAALGGDPGDSGWLGSDACAGALAYTPHERLPMLLRNDVLVRRPPFTNQLTHVADEARNAREIEAARKVAEDPAATARAAEVAKAALARDPDNPELAAILEGIDLDLGDLEGALVLARRAGELLPADFATSADEASILMRLGRIPEAEALLSRAAASGADMDLLAPVMADFWTRAQRTGEGKRFLEAAIAENPHDLRLQVVRAGILRSSGDTAGAEREFRSILAENPSSEDALESLVSLLGESGRQDEAARLSLASAGAQPRNQENSLRAVKACEAAGDADGAVRNMEAAERSGPVDATFELTLALKLYQMRRTSEMMDHLAEARRLSLAEGNPAVTDSIGALVAKLRQEPGAPQP